MFRNFIARTLDGAWKRCDNTSSECRRREPLDSRSGCPSPQSDLLGRRWRAMRIRRAPYGWAAVLALFCSAPALAQTTTPVQPTPPIPGTTTTVETTTIAGTLSQIVTPAGSAHVGDALSLAA